MTPSGWNSRSTPSSASPSTACRRVVKVHPEFADKPAFQAVLSKDPKRIRALGARELFKILLATMSGMTPWQFSDKANAWLA